MRGIAAADVRTRRLVRRDYARDSASLARRLLGAVLVRVLDDGERLSGVIVETEAYLGVPDRAAHSFGGRRTARNEPMYGPPGLAYVYFTYGMHHCFNVVAGEAGEPVAVLVRALEPLEGRERMRANRAGPRRRSAILDTDLCSGPARLCQALSIDRRQSGLDLIGSEVLWIETGARKVRESEVVVGPRIGVGYAAEWAARPLRWRLRDHPHVSK